MNKLEEIKRLYKQYNVCATCHYFRVREDAPGSGNCRRYPPVADFTFPMVLLGHYCGEWKLAATDHPEKEG